MSAGGAWDAIFPRPVQDATSTDSSFAQPHQAPANEPKPKCLRPSRSAPEAKPIPSDNQPTPVPQNSTPVIDAAEAGANGKAQPMPSQGEHVINELLDELAAEIDASSGADENSHEVKQPPCEPKTPEEKRAVEQSFVALAKTLIGQGKTKAEVMDQLKAETLKYTTIPMSDATAERYYNKALKIQEQRSALVFPAAGYVGVPAKIADLYSRYLESPKEFLYLDMLALIGTAIDGRVEVNLGGLRSRTTLYVLKIARSGWSRKSTSTRLCEKIIQRAIIHADGLSELTEGVPATLEMIPGVGSAEGLMQLFRHEVDAKTGGKKWVGNPRLVLRFDEFRRFEKKSKGESAVLLYMLNELFDATNYTNATRDESRVSRIDNAHLGFISCTTDETFQSLVDATELADIGFLNRLFIVSAESERRVAWPRPVPRSEETTLTEELAELFKGLPPVDEAGYCAEPIRLEPTEDAREQWSKWYDILPRVPLTTRLDAIGPRLMTILAFVTGKREIDFDVVRATIALLNHQYRLREAYQPIIADDKKARLQQRILQQYMKNGPLTEAQCHRNTNGNRASIEDWNAAHEAVRLAHLKSVGVVKDAAGKKSEQYDLKSRA